MSLKCTPGHVECKFNHRNKKFVRKVPKNPPFFWKFFLKNACSRKTKKSPWLNGCNFQPVGDNFFRKVRKIPGQFSKTIIHSSTFSKSVHARKFPPDTQNAMLTSKLEEFYQDSQIISVKSREHSPGNSQKNPKTFFCGHWGPFWWNWLTVSAKKQRVFQSNFEILEVISFFFKKNKFSHQKFLCLRRMQLWQVFAEKLYFSEKFIRTSRVHIKNFSGENPKIQSSEIWKFLSENSFCREKSISLKCYFGQVECICGQRTEYFFTHSEIIQI